MPKTARTTSARLVLVLRVVVALISALAVAVTGTIWWSTRTVFSGFTVSQALPSDGPRSTGGAVNILLIGLDSRKDQEGKDLPRPILDQLHAGDSDSGGYNTNTLILVHIAADNRVTAFSIPRDDYVAFSRLPGYHHIKIKEAYGLTKAATEQKLAGDGVTDQATLESRGREAGRVATLSAVRSLVGVPIDYFAEINLAGFYDLAATLGGVDVCLNHAVHDSYSGANFPEGPQTLDAAQALAFVRQRHGLENGDLDRTHRQQAFLISVMRQLQDAGTFSDLTKLQSLMAIAHKDIVLSTGWGIDQFRRLGTIAGADVEYQTLPVVRYDTIDGQDVNIIDPAQIKAQVQAAFSDGIPATTTAVPNPSTTIEVVNAGYTPRLARTVAEALRRHNYSNVGVGDPSDPVVGESTSTTIDYGPGAESDAQDIAALLGDVAIEADPGAAAGHIRIVLGAGYQPPSTLESTESSTATVADAGGRTSTSDSSGTRSTSDSSGTRSTSDSSGTRSTSDASTEAPDHGLPVDGGGTPCVN
jgi:LCP family protein required for cell wall assembly